MSSSEADMSSEQTRGFPMFLPFILGLSAAAVDAALSAEGDETGGGNGERVVIINEGTGSVVMIRGMGIMDQLNKEGPIPASKASIEALPVVKITDEGSECAICLGEYEVGGEAKEMPCKHRYHSGCIEKWLGIHGSCPVCRYKMPVEEGEDSPKVGGGDGEGGANRGRRGEIEINIFVRSRRDSDSGSDDGGVAAVGADSDSA